MLSYVLIGLCLTLTGIAGLQMTYMIYLDRMDRERKKRLHDLEQKCVRLLSKLEEADRKLDEQEAVIASLSTAVNDQEHWADVIDER